MAEHRKEKHVRRIFMIAGLIVAAVLSAILITDIILNRLLYTSSATATQRLSAIMGDYKHSFLMYEEIMKREIEVAADEDEISAFLKSRDKSFQNIDGADYDGIYMYYNDRYLYSWDTPYSVYEESGYNAKERPWYIGAVEANGGIWFSVPYRSYANDYMLSTISRLQPDGKTVFAYDIKLGAIQSYTKELELYNGSLTLLCDNIGNIIGSNTPVYAGGNCLLTNDAYDKLIAETETELSTVSGDADKVEKKLESLQALKELCTHSRDAIKQAAENKDRVTCDISNAVLCYYHASGDYTCITIIPVAGTLPMLLIIWAALTLVLVLLAFLIEYLRSRRKHTLELNEKNCQLAEAVRRADAANIAKSQFLARMSHDIRTPMNAIINIARLAQDDYAGTGGESILADMKQIETVSDFLMGLLNDVLDMSSIEQGKFQLHPEVYHYADFLHYINTVFEPLCADRKIHFVCEPGSTDIAVIVDKVRFNQLFLNLLSNAVKFTPEGGTVTYRLTDSTVSGGSISCIFEVSDTGCGISEEFQSRMFEPFEREEETSSAYQGTGLGLSIAKNIITLMGGNISVRSKQGEGTSFIISLALPIATEEQRCASAPETESADSLAGRRILVVEDNETNIIVLTRYLAKRDVITTVARDGKEAVEMFTASEEGIFDLILMDLRMPVMDGLEATRIIRSMDRPDAREIPILAMTADAFDNDVEATKAAGMNAHLTKPVVAETLYRIVGQFCKE